MCSRSTALCVSAVIGLAAFLGVAAAQQSRPAEQTAVGQNAAGEEPDRPIEISGPYTHENLAVYLVHGEDRLKGRDLLTLAEALEQKKARILETSDVDELTIENLSKDEEIFVQAGDIVKGGKQDRVCGVDVILAANSGKVKIKVFCVEQGRWSQRGSESVAGFSSSYSAAPSNELKMAIRQKGDQQKVWSGVAETQRKLARNVGAPVASQASETSLQLSLENKQLRRQTSEYTSKLSKVPAGKDDVVGVVMAINGELESADTYASPKLFRKLWPKLLEAGATEAIAARDGKKKQASPPATKAVQEFLTVSAGKAKTTEVSKRIKTVERESEGRIMFQMLDAQQGSVPVHGSYLKKAKEK